MLKRGPQVDVIVGTQGLTRLPMLADQRLRVRQPSWIGVPHDDVSFPLGVARRGHESVRAYVTIIEGCNEFLRLLRRALHAWARANATDNVRLVEEVREAADSGPRRFSC